jgi:hypothetical protein
MSYDQVRATLPRADWQRAYQAIAAKHAISIGDETLSVEYSDQAWDRYRMVVTGGARGIDRDRCLDRSLRFFAHVEQANGRLDPYPLPVEYKDVREVRAFGKASQATLLTKTQFDRTGSTGFYLAAHQTRGAILIRANAVFQVFNTVGQQDSCTYTAALEAMPSRPPQGVVPFDLLEVSLEMSIGALHHSLDGAPQVPPGGIAVDVQCTVPEDSARLYDCKAIPNATASPFERAALTRASEVTVKTRRTRDGRWTPGELTRPRIKLLPSERRAAGPVDTSKSGLLQMIGKKLQPRLDQRILERLPTTASATVDVGCIVQSDGSLICPEIKVKATSNEEDFVAAALGTLLRTRFEPRLSNGEPSEGVGYRTSIEYRLN